MPKIILIPTSHIAQESLENIKKAVLKEKPDCIAVELDMNRYYALKFEESGSAFEMIKVFGPFAFLFYYLLKYLQRALGKKTGILPGSEMLEGIKLAQDLGLKIAFIDQDIRVTLFKIQKVSWREKAKLMFFVIKAFWIIRRGNEKNLEEGYYIDLNKVPPKNLINQAMKIFKKEFPSLYKILVDDRNKYMAKNLIKLSDQFEKIVAIIGAGHEEGIRKILEKSGF